VKKYLAGGGSLLTELFDGGEVVPGRVKKKTELGNLGEQGYDETSSEPRTEKTGKGNRPGLGSVAGLGQRLDGGRLGGAAIILRIMRLRRRKGRTRGVDLRCICEKEQAQGGVFAYHRKDFPIDRKIERRVKEQGLRYGGIDQK